MRKNNPIYKRALMLAVPMMIQNGITNMVSLVDNIMVGSQGTEAMTAVSIASQLIFVFNLAIFGGLSGPGIYGAQYYGQHNLEGFQNTFRIKGWITTLCLIGGLLVFLLGDDTLIGLYLHGESATVDAGLTMTFAKQYLHIMLIGLPFFVVTQVYASSLRETGSSVKPMVAGVASVAVDVVLNYMLIYGNCGMPKLGVRGAAIATVLSQAVGAIWVIRFLTGPKTILKIRKEDMKLEGKIIMPVLALGISTFVMLSTESLLSISFSSSLARYGGDVAVGAMTVITSASQLCTLPIQGVCQGGQPVMSFNFGAGKKPRVKEAFRFQLTLCGAYTCLFWLAMMLAPGAVAGIFTSDSALISYTTWAMRIYMAGIFAMGFQIACQQSFMALGQAKVSLLLACLRKIILLIPLIFILPHLVAAPVFGVFLAEPVSDILAATITTITFFARFDRILEKGAARV